MKTIKVVLPIIISIIFSSCKKDYTCVCTDPSGTIAVFTVKDTKKKATAECNDYYKNNYSAISWNETSCEIKYFYFKTTESEIE